MRSDPEIVIADHLAPRFQLRPNRSIRFGRRFRQEECRQQMHELTQPLKRRNPLGALCRVIVAPSQRAAARSDTGMVRRCNV